MRFFGDTAIKLRLPRPLSISGIFPTGRLKILPGRLGRKSMAYYHDLITQKSFEVLTALRRKYDFILIGGWAVFLYTHNLKSKDVDLVVEYKDLEKLKHDFEVV